MASVISYGPTREPAVNDMTTDGRSCRCESMGRSSAFAADRSLETGNTFSEGRKDTSAVSTVHIHRLKENGRSIARRRPDYIWRSNAVCQRFFGSSVKDQTFTGESTGDDSQLAHQR